MSNVHDQHVRAGLEQRGGTLHDFARNANGRAYAQPPALVLCGVRVVAFPGKVFRRYEANDFLALDQGQFLYLVFAEDFLRFFARYVGGSRY